MPANHSTHPEEPPAQPEMGRILRFEPRRGPRLHVPLAPLGHSPVADLDKYSRDREDSEDYVNRMRANLAAVLVVVLLIISGYWLFNTLAEMRRDQDCILSGRTNCAPIVLPSETGR